MFSPFSDIIIWNQLVCVQAKINLSKFLRVFSPRSECMKRVTCAIVWRKYWNLFVQYVNVRLLMWSTVCPLSHGFYIEQYLISSDHRCANLLIQNRLKKGKRTMRIRSVCVVCDCLLCQTCVLYVTAGKNVLHQWCSTVESAQRSRTKKRNKQANDCRSQ